MEEFTKNIGEVMNQENDNEEMTSNEKKEESIAPYVGMPVEEDCKKIVVYVYGDNIDYVNQLSHEEKNKIVNESLAVSRVKRVVETKKDTYRNYIVHFVIIGITLILFTPVIFTVVNKSFELTVKNYKTSEQNFMQLYKDKNALQKKDLSKMKKMKHK